MIRRVLMSSGHHLLRAFGRRTPNPYAPVTELTKKYGQYGKYFDDPEDALIKYDDKWDKHKKIIPFDFGEFDTTSPMLAMEHFIAENATLAGNIEVWNGASIWYGCVLKAERTLIRIGAQTNIQDNTVIHEAFHRLAPDHDGSTIVGHNVTVGHSCQLRGCTIEDFCLVGVNSILQEGSYMERMSELGANSVLQSDQRIPSGELWAGNPARYIRHLTAAELRYLEEHYMDYYQYSLLHKDQFYLPNPQHVLAEARNLPIGYVRRLGGSLE